MDEDESDDSDESQLVGRHLRSHGTPSPQA